MGTGDLAAQCRGPRERAADRARVLMWARRDRPDQSLDTQPPSPLQPNTPAAPPATCTPFVWDPTSQNVTTTPRPTLGDAAKTPANLFCSGHWFLRTVDFSSRVAILRRRRSNQTCVYDAGSNTLDPKCGDERRALVSNPDHLGRWQRADPVWQLPRHHWPGRGTEYGAGCLDRWHGGSPAEQHRSRSVRSVSTFARGVIRKGDHHRFVAANVVVRRLGRGPLDQVEHPARQRPARLRTIRHV